MQMREKGQITLNKTTKITGNFVKEITEAKRLGYFQSHVRKHLAKYYRNFTQ